MKQFGVFLTLAAVIVVLGTCPALAYRPPLDITANVTGNTITYSVFDPELGKTVSESLSYSQPISDFQNNNGVLAWVITDVEGYLIHCNIYNPTLHKFNGGSFGRYPQVTNLTVDSGVVAFQAIHPFSTTYEINLFIYSPTKATWVGTGYGISGPVSCLQNKDGVVAFIDGNWARFMMLDLRYDPGNHNIFRYRGVDASPDSPSSLNITNGTVSYVTGGQLNTWGYDGATGKWVNGITTKPIAYFLAQPSSGAKPPLWVWFTDASIGATDWSWQFGDGSPSIAQSPFYNYTQYGSFKVTQTITGPNGVDTCIKNIRIGGASLPLDLLLLGD
jgi:hypothetical protein